MSLAGRRIKPFHWFLVVVPLMLVGGAWLYAATLATRTFPINGTYWISLPANPSPPVTNAEELLALLPFETVARFRTETDLFHTWDGTTCTPGIDPEAVGPGAPCTTACFCVIPGEGYQVSVNNAPVDWEIEGQDGYTSYAMPAAGPQSLTGNHLIALPTARPPGFDNASDLFTDTGAQLVGRYLPAADAVQIYAFGTPDWPLAAGEGYLAKVLQDNSAYTPQVGGLPYYNPCIQPDVNGTVELPPIGCGYFSPRRLHMAIAGLPEGTVVHLNAAHAGFVNVRRSAPRSLAGATTESFDSELILQITGTGLASFVDCSLTISNVSVTVDSDPAQPGQDVQEFDTEMRSISAQVTNETQCNLFSSLSIIAGSDHGLSSPGHTRLVRRPDGTFDVDSHFEVQNTISFVGKPGGPLAGFSGSTTNIVSMGTPMTPGEAGGSPIPLVVTAYDRGTEELSLSYGPACWANNHDLYYGNLDQVSSLAWSGSLCSIGDSGSFAGFNPGPDSYFFVVVGNRGVDEGSYGKRSGGVERPPFAASACRREQLLSNTCE